MGMSSGSKSIPTRERNDLTTAATVAGSLSLYSNHRSERRGPPGDGVADLRQRHLVGIPQDKVAGVGIGGDRDVRAVVVQEGFQASLDLEDRLPDGSVHDSSRCSPAGPRRRVSPEIGM